MHIAKTVYCYSRNPLLNLGYHCLKLGYPLFKLGYLLFKTRLPIVSNWATLGYLSSLAFPNYVSKRTLCLRHFQNMY